MTHFPRFLLHSFLLAPLAALHAAAFDGREPVRIESGVVESVPTPENEVVAFNEEKVSGTVFLPPSLVPSGVAAPSEAPPRPIARRDDAIWKAPCAHQAARTFGPSHAFRTGARRGPRCQLPPASPRLRLRPTLCPVAPDRYSLGSPMTSRQAHRRNAVSTGESRSAGSS